MSNTIGNYINGITTIYENDSADSSRPELTQMDFLATLALDTICGKELDLSTLDCHRRYRKDPDSFINETLGKPGTAKRICYEAHAHRLYENALRFLDSKDEVSSVHPYLLTAERIESNAGFCE